MAKRRPSRSRMENIGRLPDLTKALAAAQGVDYCPEPYSLSSLRSRRAYLRTLYTLVREMSLATWGRADSDTHYLGWYQPVTGEKRWGVARMARRTRILRLVGKGFETSERREYRWQWVLHHNGEDRRRSHPDLWFFCFPAGGCLVIPDSVLQPTWVHMQLRAGFRTWLWAFWERWDIITTYPNMPADLVLPEPQTEAAVPAPPVPAAVPDLSADPCADLPGSSALLAARLRLQSFFPD